MLLHSILLDVLVLVFGGTAPAKPVGVWQYGTDWYLELRYDGYYHACTKSNGQHWVGKWRMNEDNSAVLIDECSVMPDHTLGIPCSYKFAWPGPNWRRTHHNILPLPLPPRLPTPGFVQ